MPAKYDYNAKEMLSDFMSELLSYYQKGKQLSIVEFAEQIIFNGDEKLYIGQRTLLKAFYGEELEPEEQSLLDCWSLESQNRTTWVKGREYTNLIVECGRGGSKSLLAAIISLYEFYNLIILDSPARHYGLIGNDPIALFVIARSADQVKDTLFAKIVGYAKNSLLFRALEKKGDIEILTESIRHKEKNVAIFAKHTNSQSLVGYNLKLLILDEAARFDSNELGINKADEVWGNVGKGVSRFGKHGRKVMISSAWKDGDPIQRYYNSAKHDRYSLGFRLTTWHLNLNPHMARNSPPVESDYSTNPAQARLEYEGIRFSSLNSFIDKSYVEKARSATPCLDSVAKVIELRAGDEVRKYSAIELVRLESSIEPHFVHLDLALKKDSAALAICHSIIKDSTYCIQVDGVIQWVPLIDKDGEQVVSFTNMEEVLFKLCRNRNVQLVTFDQFNSAGTNQRLMQKGIRSDILSSARQAQLSYYRQFRTLMEEGKILLPRDGIWSALLETQLTSIQILDTGKIIHTKAGKDLADAVTQAVWNCFQWQIKSGKITINPTAHKTMLKAHSSRKSESRIYKLKERRII